MTTLSVVIVSFNTKELTLQCIKSIVESKPKLSYELIVVDNNSEDGTVQEIKNYKSDLKIIENNENLGFAKGNNQGIKVAKGKYILLLNSDTQVKKRTLNKMVSFAQNNSDVGGVAPKLLNPDGSVQGSVFRLPTVVRTLKQYWFGQKGILDKYAPSGDKPKEIESAVMAAFLMTPEAIKNVGLLDDRYFMYFEDHDYCRRLRAAELKVYYLPEVEVFHYHGESGKNLADTANQWRRLIPSSKIYHGTLKHYLISFIIWTGQKWERLFH